MQPKKFGVLAKKEFQMKLKVLVALIVILSVVFLVVASDASPIHSKKGFNVGNMVKNASIVVVGRVEQTEFVYRSNWVPTYTTDVTIDVTDVIKGDVNADDPLVFMVIGGSGVNPETGEDLTLEVTATPKFTVGEQTLLFLKTSSRRGHPHNGLYVSAGDLGKRAVTDGKILMPYSYQKNFGGKSKKIYNTFEMSLDLVVKIAKASIEDFDVIKAKEAAIATALAGTPSGQLPALNEALVQQLKTTAEQALEAARDNAAEND